MLHRRYCYLERHDWTTYDTFDSSISATSRSRTQSTSRQMRFCCRQDRLSWALYFCWRTQSTGRKSGSSQGLDTPSGYIKFEKCIGTFQLLSEICQGIQYYRLSVASFVKKRGILALGRRTGTFFLWAQRQALYCRSTTTTRFDIALRAGDRLVPKRHGRSIESDRQRWKGAPSVLRVKKLQPSWEELWKLWGGMFGSSMGNQSFQRISVWDTLHPFHRSWTIEMVDANKQNDWETREMEFTPSRIRHDGRTQKRSSQYECWRT